MTFFAALLGLALVLGVLTSLISTIARDGYGSRPVPRSHPEEVGSWVVQRLQP